MVQDNPAILRTCAKHLRPVCAALVESINLKTRIDERA